MGWQADDTKTAGRHTRKPQASTQMQQVCKQAEYCTR